MYHKFLEFTENLKNSSNEHLLECVEHGFKACFEAHTGLYRTLDRFVDELDLEAKNWPKYVKKELYANHDWGLFGRNVLELKEIHNIQKKLIERVKHAPEKEMNSIKNEFDFVDHHLEDSIERFDEIFQKNQVFIEKLFYLDVKFDDVDVLTLTLDDFTNNSKKAIMERIQNQDNFDTDNIRHKKQKEIIIQNNGLNPEPVILIQINGKYKLHEGWHRTSQVILYNKENGSDTFKLKAYVGHFKPDTTKQKINHAMYEFKKGMKIFSDKIKNFLKKTYL